MGEMARFYNDMLAIGAPLHVVPVSGWKRTMWFDETGLPWVRPSPNLPTLTSALIYPALVAFEGTNVSVGRGTADAFQRFGAPWMNAPEVASLLNGRHPPGVRFDGRLVHAGESGRRQVRRPPHPWHSRRGHRPKCGAARDICARQILWALLKRESRFVARSATRTSTSATAARQLRQALFNGEDPDHVVEREQPAVTAFQASARRFLLY